jgi:hypothetical protein
MEIDKILKKLRFKKQLNKGIEKTDAWFIKSVEIEGYYPETKAKILRNKVLLNITISDVKPEYQNRGIYVNIYLDDIYFNRTLYRGFIDSEEFLKQILKNIQLWK